MTKKNDAVQDRKARVEALRRQAAKADRRRTTIIGGAAALGVAAIVAGSIWVVRSSSSSEQIKGITSVDGQSRNHVQGAVKYPQTPPVGGDHAEVWQNCGVYTKPIANENGVHSLEHGAVWIAYRPDLAPDQVAKLEAAAKNQPYLLLTPFVGLAAPVVASAWGKQVTLLGAEDPRLATFIRTYANGPETPEPGAACTGGLGEPN